MSEKFEHLNKDYTNVPKNIEDFKNKIPDVNPEYYWDIQNMFSWLSKHPDPKVSDAAKDLLAYFNKEILNPLKDSDKKGQNIISKEVMQAANNIEYRPKDFNKEREYRNIS